MMMKTILIIQHQQELSSVEDCCIPDTVIGILHTTHFLFNTTLYNYPRVTDDEMKIV